MNNEERYLSRSLDERDLISKKYKFLKVAHLHDILGMHDREEISYSRMVEVINELAFDFYRGLVSDVSLANVSDWVANSKTIPEYDGNYLCYINQPQECGNIWRYYKTVHLERGKWVLQEGEQVIFWTNRAFPFHISPEPPCR